MRGRANVITWSIDEGKSKRMLQEAETLAMKVLKGVLGPRTRVFHTARDIVA